MSNIFIISGKSGSGKDTILRILKEYFKDNEDFAFPIQHTTRPIRDGEMNGEEYIFDSIEDYNSYTSDEFVDNRSYDVKLPNGEDDTWYYYYLKKDFNDSNKNYIMIGTDETFNFVYNIGFCLFFRIYIKVDEDTRLLRLLKREAKQSNCNIKELIRRIENDKDPFVPDSKIIENDGNLYQSALSIVSYILEKVNKLKFSEFYFNNLKYFKTEE